MVDEATKKYNIGLTLMNGTGFAKAIRLFDKGHHPFYAQPFTDIAITPDFLETNRGFTRLPLLKVFRCVHASLY